MKAVEVGLCKESYIIHANRKVEKLNALIGKEVYDSNLKFIGIAKDMDVLRKDSKIIDNLFKNIGYERKVIKDKSTVYGTKVIGSGNGNVILEY